MSPKIIKHDPTTRSVHFVEPYIKVVLITFLLSIVTFVDANVQPESNRYELNSNVSYELTTTKGEYETQPNINVTLHNVPTKARNKNQQKTNNKHERNTHKPSQNHRQNTNAKQGNQRESQPDQEKLRPEHTCLISDVCMRENRLGYCYKPHKPHSYHRDNRETEDFYEMLMENCPHFFDADENLLHPLCCSPEQEETISRLNNNVDLIRRSCPSCLVNAKKLFCNLFCAPNQRDFVRIERVKRNTVMEVTYAMSDHFVNNFFSSCQNVRVFGAYLLDFEYGCGKLKRANCTPIEFIQILGSLSEIPLKFRPLIINHKRDHLNQWPRHVMNDTVYECDQAPPNHSACHCDHCPKACANKPFVNRNMALGESTSAHLLPDSFKSSTRYSVSECSRTIQSTLSIAIFIIISSTV